MNAVFCLSPFLFSFFSPLLFFQTAKDSQGNNEDDSRDHYPDSCSVIQDEQTKKIQDILRITYLEILSFKELK